MKKSVKCIMKNKGTIQYLNAESLIVHKRVKSLFSGRPEWNRVFVRTIDEEIYFELLNPESLEIKESGPHDQYRREVWISGWTIEGKILRHFGVGGYFRDNVFYPYNIESLVLVEISHRPLISHLKSLSLNQILTSVVLDRWPLQPYI